MESAESLVNTRVHMEGHQMVTVSLIAIEQRQVIVPATEWQLIHTIITLTQLTLICK